MTTRREWAVDYPGGLTHVSDDRADAEDMAQWVKDGQLVTRLVDEGEWQTPDVAEAHDVTLDPDTKGT